MTIQELRSALRVEGGTLVVTPATLNSADVTRVLEEYFAGARLAVGGATIASGPGDPFVLVRGTVRLLGVDVTGAEIRFFVDAGVAQLTLGGSLPAGWTFADSFPSLTGDPLGTLRLGSATVALASAAGAGQGLVLDAGYPLPAAWEVLRWFADPGGAARISGPVEIDGGEPVATLSVSPAIRASLGGYLSVDLTLQHLARTFRRPSARPGMGLGDISVLAPAPASAERMVAAIARLSGSLSFTRGGSRVDVPLAAYLGGEASVLRFRMDTAEAFDFAFSEIAHWVNGADLGTEALPSFYRPPGGLTLHAVEFAVGLRTRSLEYISLAIQSTTPWTVIEGVLVVEQVGASLLVLRPGADLEVAATLGGRVRIAGVELEVHAQVPDFRIEGGLAEGSSVDLSPLLGGHLGGDHGVPSTLTIGDLRFSAHPAGSEYGFHLGVVGDWVIVPGVSITGITMEIERRGAGEDTSTAVHVEAFFTVAGVGMIVSAARSAEVSSGWRFEGGTTPGRSISIRTLIHDLASTFGVDATPPASIASATIDRLHVSFDTATRAFTFSCKTKLPLDSGTGTGTGTELDLVVDVNVEPSGTGYRKTFRGTVLVGRREFDLVFDSDPAATRFLAAYENLSGGSADLGTLLSGIVDAPGLSALSIDLKDALLAYDDTAGGTAAVLFGADIGAGVDLANLPLVGRAFPSGSSLTLAFQPLVASALFSEAMLDGVRPLVPAGGLALPKGPLAQGLTLATRLQVGAQPIDLSLPLTLDSGGQIQHTGGAAPAPAGSTSAPSDGTHWIKLQKSFGPLHLQRIGARYDAGNLWFLLDGALAAGGLTLELDGLGVGVALSDIRTHTFRPKFSLRGISIDYTNGPVEVGGSLLHLPPATPADPDEYDGSAVIRTSALNLFVLGSYAERNGSRSLFLYGALNYPIGGPPFCFVTGLAAGFGFNRTVRRPTLDQVATFPLVAEAMSGAATPPAAGTNPRSYLEEKLQALHEYLPVQTGSMFFAVGIHFTTFKLVDSFALVTVKVGPHVEVDVLGLSTGYLPPSRDGQPATPVAELQLALEASFRPDEGLLAVAAQLTRESYLLSRDCHLTGGFAFYCWFKGDHAGDFVLTVGGYHPSFRVPAHYPTVPRLGFNWQVTGDLSLKGGMYFALTAHALMAGGELEAVWESGSLRAWFRAEANFLVAWQPYHYEAGISVNMGVSYTYWFFGTHHISVDVGADLNVWGPDFSGTARVHLWIVSFTISFGADASPPPALGWGEFSKAFLPAHDGHVAVGITAARGLSRRMPLDGGGELWIVDPKTLVISITTPVPVTAATAGGRAVAGPYAPVGIAPMDKRSQNVASTMEIGTTHRVALADTRAPDTESFTFKAVHGRAPAALWGNSRSPDVNAHSWVDGTVAAIDVSPATPATPPRDAVPHRLRRADLTYTPDVVAVAQPVRPTHRFTPGAAFDRAEFDRAAFVDAIASDTTVAARAAFLRSLGLDPALVTGLERTNAADFLFAPRVGRMTLAA
jgi:hypothetical protein